MRFNPKEAWESVCVLSGGDTRYHASPTIMRMRLPNGELETTYVEMPPYLAHTFTGSLTIID